VEKELRHIINEYDEILPTILEIPSKDVPYDPKKDTIMQKANRLLYGRDPTD
jgi:V-type H+-transporting ATPase subunit F